MGVENAIERVLSPAVTDVMAGAVGAAGAARVTTTAVVVDTPVFVATTLMVLEPVANEIALDATPDDATLPPIVSVVEECPRVAVTLIDVVR